MRVFLEAVLDCCGTQGQGIACVHVTFIREYTESTSNLMLNVYTRLACHCI